jgi:hypothetical protein
MNTKANVDGQTHGSPEKTPLDKRRAEHLRRFSEECKKQLSDEELEEARRRGCYKVLPPVAAPHEKDPTMSELLQEIDEAVKKALILF